MRRLPPALLVSIALVLAGQAAAADVDIVRIRALAPEHGLGAGRVVLLATVRYAPTRSFLVGAPNPARTADIGRLELSVAGVRKTDADQLVRGARKPIRYTHRIVLGRAASARARSEGRLRLTAEVEQFVRGGERPPTGSLRAVGRVEARVLRVPALPPAPPPLCERAPLEAPFSRETTLTVVCMGEGARIRLGGRPRHGRVRLLRAVEQRSVLAYEASDGYVGRDSVPIRVTGGAKPLLASVRVDVQPFKLSALGDSVTAGFGYLGNGTQWSAVSLLSCIPPTQPNNRCSSNSPNGVGSTGPVGWLPDFGLSNDVAWPAQFANEHGLTGAGQFANRAVSGSAPTDWASGYLNHTLQGIVDDRPDLVVMTLGGNPLLDTFLFGHGLQCAFARTDPALAACVQSFVDKVGLAPNIQSVVSQLLAAQGTRVVISQYHLAVPASSLYTVHQLEVMFGVLNADIGSAVRQMSAFGSRVFVMTPTRFFVGLEPGTYKCPGVLFDSQVDGPSHQATVSQTFLTGLHPFSFCSGAPWIISTDSGIHPNAAGYSQFAAALDQVVGQNGLLPVVENR